MAAHGRRRLHARCPVRDADDPPPPDRNGDDRNRHRSFLTTFIELWGTGVVEQRGHDEKALHVVQALDVGEATRDDRPFTLRLLHCAGRDEVWLDDRRLLYLPGGCSPRKVGFEIYATGVTVHANVDFQKLDPSQVPAN